MSEKINVLITGAGGYLGSEAIKAITKDERFGTIVGTDVRDKPAHFEGIDFEYIKADIRDENMAEMFTKYKIDTVVHLASIVTPPKGMDREFIRSVEVDGTKNILDCCLKAKVKKIIVTTSGASYGYYPDNPEWLVETDKIRGNEEFAYSHHKKLIEFMLEEYRNKHPELKQLIFRPGTILGDTTKNQITDLFEKKFVMGIQGSKTPFVFIWDRDLVNCLIKGMAEDKTGIYNMAGDGAVNLKDIARILGKPFISIPVPVLKGALTVLHKLGLTQYGPEQLNFLRYRPVLLNKSLKEDFGYTPEKTSLETFHYYLRKKKNVFITGGTSGLGLEVAKLYLKEGHNVAVCSFEEEAVARKNIPAEFDFYQADVTDTKRMNEVVYEFKKKVGRLDVVIANAGITMSKTRIPDFERGRRVINTNVNGVLNTFEPAVNIMKDQKSGQLVALSSLAGTIGGLPGMSIYCASKSAVYSLCEGLEIDLAAYGIKVTAIAPGFITTPMTAHHQHKRPFLLSQEKAGELMFNAVEDKKGLYLFPYPMMIVSGILRRLPRGFYKWIMKKDMLGTAEEA